MGKKDTPEIAREALSMRDFENAYDIGHTKACEEIKSGRLQSYKLGRRRYISRRAAEEWQRNLETNGGAR